MKNRKRYLYYTLLLAFSAACSGKHVLEEQARALPEPQPQSQRISAAQAEAAGAYFTSNHLQAPVLCWTEQLQDSTKKWVLKYATYHAEADSFGLPIVVVPSVGTRPHDESMNKIAFKADGTTIAMWSVKHPTEDNPFASSIYYSLSADAGKSWSPAAYLHADTLPQWGRGFFDLAQLPDGEVGAVWLDGRLGDKEEGSALFFAKTTPGKGFGPDRQIGSSTCECCRTDLYVDARGVIHVSYRDISFPAEQAGKQIRDLSYSYSTDGGNSFSPAATLSPDNWQLEGCPHTGPSLASNAQGLHVVWFTAGGSTGLYYSLRAPGSDRFSGRAKLSDAARHPQLVKLQNTRLAVLWDEVASQQQLEEPLAASVHAGAHGGHGNHAAAAEGASSIMLYQLNESSTPRLQQVSDPGAGSASHALGMALPHGRILVAWTQRAEEQRSIHYKILKLE